MPLNAFVTPAILNFRHADVMSAPTAQRVNALGRSLPRGMTGSDEHNLREAIDQMVKELAFAPNIVTSPTAWLEYWREGRLEALEPTFEVVQRATSWAAILHAYTVKRLTRRA